MQSPGQSSSDLTATPNKLFSQPLRPWRVLHRRLTSVDGVKSVSMPNEKLSIPETQEPASAAVDWADLRAQAAKLGISLSELQQRDREKKLRLARKSQVRTPQPAVPPIDPIEP